MVNLKLVPFFYELTVSNSPFLFWILDDLLHGFGGAGRKRQRSLDRVTFHDIHDLPTQPQLRNPPNATVYLN